MWTRDVPHVASAALGAYAFSEIAARVVGDAVAPDAARWLTLVALAVAAAAFALVARADARRARADAAEAERRARRDARFRAAVLERVARRDPARDPEDATRVDCLAALARVIDAGAFVDDERARSLDPSPDLPPLLATPARREAARRAAKASEARRARDWPLKDPSRDLDGGAFVAAGGARRLAPPTSFTAADVADGAVRLSRALARPTDPVEVALSVETGCSASARLSGKADFGARADEPSSARGGRTRTRTRTFAAGGCSLDRRDGADRVACVAAMLVDLARRQSRSVLEKGEPRRVANEGRPCVVRLRLEFGPPGGADGVGERSHLAARRARGRKATWTTTRLAASLTAPRDARRVVRENKARSSVSYRSDAEEAAPNPRATESESESERDASLTRAALVHAASALGGSFTKEPATGPDAVGETFACAFPLLITSASLGVLGEEEEEEDAADSFRLDPKLPDLFARRTNFGTASDDGHPRAPRAHVEAVFHPSVSSGRRAHCRRILEAYPGARVVTAATAEAATAATAAALRGGRFALVVCASPTGLETTAAARAAVAAVAARETLAAAAAAAETRREDAGRRGAALLLAAVGGDLDAAREAAREASADAGDDGGREHRAGGPEPDPPRGGTRRLAPTPESPETPEADEADETETLFGDGAANRRRSGPVERFEFAAVASPATSEEMHAALCAALRRGAEAAAAAAADAAAARRAAAAAVSARRASSSATNDGRAFDRVRRLSDRSDDGEFADFSFEKAASERGVATASPSTRAPRRDPEPGSTSGSPANAPAADSADPADSATPATPAPEPASPRRVSAERASSPPGLESHPDASSPSVVSSSPRPRGSESLEGMRVLVVDDNHFQLRIVKASLKGLGLELDTAVHGREAADLAARRFERGADAAPYDAIIMDSMMPVMDGLEATREIRAAEKAFRAALPPAARAPGGAFEHETVIIGLSAESGPEYETGARAAGMDGALGKPCRPEALRDALRRVREGTFNSWKGGSKRGTLHF